MFDRISGDYDRMNRILSFGTDVLWRRNAIRIADVKNGSVWLDMAAGSGDMTATGVRRVPESTWVSMDPSIELLKRLMKRTDIARKNAVLASAEEIPADDGTFDGATVAFGVRNFENKHGGLQELYRVLKPDGKLVILEFLSAEKGKWGAGPLVRFYLEKVLPKIGTWVSGDSDAYCYLARTSKNFWDAPTMTKALKECGFKTVEHRPWMGGAVTLTIAGKG